MTVNFHTYHFPYVTPMAGTFMGFPSSFSRVNFPQISLFQSLLLLNLIRVIDWCILAEVWTFLFLLEITATYFKAFPFLYLWFRALSLY